MADRVIRFVLTGDNSGAIRAMDETAVASDKTGKSVEKTGKHAKTAAGEFTVLERSTGRLRSTLKYVAGAAGIGGLFFGIKDAINVGKEWQSQQAQLRNALKNTGQASATHLREINEAVEKSATHGGFKGVEETGGIAQFVRLTHDSTKALKLNEEAVDFARGAHVNYSEAVRMVSQIQTGNTGRLQKYLGVIKPITYYTQSLTAEQKKQNPALYRHAQLLDKQATATLANSRLVQKFSGATTSYSRTAAGEISNVQHRFERMAEMLGEKLLPYVADAALALSHVADTVIADWPQISAQIKKVTSDVKATVGWFRRHKDATKALAAGLGVLVTAMIAVKIATFAWTKAQAALNLVMALNPIEMIIIGIAALTAGVVYCYLHFKTFRHVVDTTFRFLRGAVEFVVGFVKKHWKLLVSILGGPFVALLVNLGKVKKAVRDIINLGKHIGGGILHHLSHPFGGLHFATGGMVPGFAGGGMVDTVPAMLTPGEGVLTRQAVQSVGGPQGVHSLNAGGGAAGGGMVPIVLNHTTELSGRVLAEEVVHYQLRMGARR